LRYVNRRSSKYPGVFQRCREDCPPDRCRKHSWSYAIDVSINRQRQQLGKGGFESAVDAAEARDEVKRRHRAGSLPEDMKIRMDAYLRQWLDEKVKREEIDESTQVSYRHHIEAHLIPQLGRIKLRDLRSRHLTTAYERIVEQREFEIAVATAKRNKRIAEIEEENDRRGAQGKKRVRSTTRGVGQVPRPLADALYRDEPLIVREIWKGAKLPKPDHHRTVPPEIAQFWALLDLARGHRLYPLMLLAGAGAGLRRGELAGLKWEDINLDTGQLVVNRQHKSVEYRVVVSEAKSDAGQRRTVMLGERMLAGLKLWKETQDAEREAWGEAYRDDGYVFTWQDGRPYHPDYLTQTVGKLMRQAGIADARLHNLRHFYAAVLISAGYDIEAVSKALGHSSVQITSKIYTALFNAAKAKMAGKAEDLVWKDRAT
jgi:integrase